MRFVVIFFIGVMYLSGKISAQERDSLVEITVGDQPRIVSEHHGIQLHPGLGIRPSLYQNFSGYDFPDHTLPTINFHYDKGWHINGETYLGIGLGPGFQGWNNYQGFYETGTYKATDKIYIGTAFSDRNFDGNSSNNRFYPQTNYSSSLFVGYKFSEKFSISAGFTIQQYNDPLNRNQRMQNIGIFP